MGAVKNYYFILGVSQYASDEEIRAAYADRYSAATSGMESVMMSELTEAYECLADPRRRKEYDDSFGRPEPRPSGNIYNFTSSETSLAAEYAFSKLRNKQRFRKSVSHKLIAAVFFLCVAGTTIFFGADYFRQPKSISEIRSDISSVMPLSSPPQPSSLTPRQSIESASGKPFARTYQIQSGGVVTQDKSACRAMPSGSARKVATMYKDTVVFATKELKDSDGSIWYYVKNSRFEGWAKETDVLIYKF